MARRLPKLPLTLAASLFGFTFSVFGPAAAQAGTIRVSVPDSYKTVAIPQHVIFEAAPGETNQLSLSSTPANLSPTPPTGLRWTLTDTGGTLSAGSGCIQIDQHSASCAVALSDSPELYLFDGDDELTSDTAAKIYAGTGDDTIRFTGDLGYSDSYAQGEAGDDLIDGALAKRLTADGGEGGDLLIGSVGNDILNGGPGTDELRGGNGDDLLTGGPGPDTFTCGAGNDTTRLDLSERLLETIECENLQLPAGGNRVAQVTVADDDVRVSGGVLTLGKRTGPRRSYDLQLRDTTGRLLGTGTLRTTVLRIRLTATGIALLKPGARETVRLLTRPAGSKTAGPKTKPGVQLDLTIGT